MEAVRLSYDGQHQAARQKFREYRVNHSEGLLVPIRISYDYLFGVDPAKMKKEEYDQLIQDMDKAIATFESRGCVGTDIYGIAGETLDCDYIGAALYSSREVLRIKKDGPMSNREINGADDTKFFLYARRSKSLQAKFLLGIHEYTASTAKWNGIPASWALKKFKKIPVDRLEALHFIASSFDDKSPFADDIWFYVLSFELKDIDQKNQDEVQLFKDHPWGSIASRLQPKYPDNQIFKKGPASLPDPSKGDP